MTTKMQKIGQWAVDNGYETIASVIRTRFSTSYWNTNNTAEHLATGGKWIAADQGFNYTIGERGSKIDWTKTVSRVTATAEAKKAGYLD